MLLRGDTLQLIGQEISAIVNGEQYYDMRCLKTIHTSGLGPATMQQPFEIGTIIGFLEELDTRLQRRRVNPALAIGDFFGATYLLPLPLFQRAHEIPRIEQARMRAGIQPRIAPPHHLDRRTNTSPEAP